jgi:hypothetical protein
MQPMYYIGLDVHKRKISYCVKDSSGKVYAEGSLAARRLDLDHWMKMLPQPWSAAMETTMFTAWIYDHLKPHAAFFLFPLVSKLGGDPSGFDKSNFQFITPMETDRGKWCTLKEINLFDGLAYQISMVPSVRQNKVISESFRIIQRQYLRKPEVKSLAPDGTPCGTTQGLLRRTKIVAGQVIAVGRETDRRWEQGEDPSMLDSKISLYEKPGKMIAASAPNRWRTAFYQI